jgi:hypothetical protein
MPLTQYTCPFIRRDGSLCGATSTRVEGCGKHWLQLKYKPTPRAVCPDCGKITFSKYGVCREHNGRYRSAETRLRKKAQKEAEKAKAAEAAKARETAELNQAFDELFGV